MVSASRAARKQRKIYRAVKGSNAKDLSPLDMVRIVAAAWTVVDRECIAGLSTHKVAAELTVKQPAIYYHVRSKQELLSLMVEQMLRASLRSPRSDLPWWEWLRDYCRETRRLLLSHKDGGLIAASAPAREQMRTELFPQALEPMIRAGMSMGQAAAAVGSLAAFVLGHVIYEQNAETRAFIETLTTPEQAFESGLDFFIAGVRNRRG